SIAGALSLPALLQDGITLRIVERPIGLLADVDPIERRLCEVDLAARDELREVSVDESEKERRDVGPVRVGVGKNDDLAVPQPRYIEVLAEAAAKRGDQI